MLSNQEKLNKAIKSVREVVSIIDWIYEQNRQMIDGNEVLEKDFIGFKRIATNTIERLEHPTLSIAMVGTTSAGKSTLVNAFIGRKVAPVESKEMSAGVLHLTHSRDISLTILPTDKAKWKVGVFNDVSDPEIYSRITEIFNQYHSLGSKVSAPQIKVQGPIEWQTNRSILNLPDNLRIEFIDLPGLKTIQDPKNLSVIQKMVSKALCIVAMDFTDVDQSRIQRLLDEVKDIVRSLNNNTEFLLFLLNKVDNVKAGQINVQEKIEELQSLISKTLNLKENKEIIPFIGHLLYLVQLAVDKNENTGDIIGYNPAILSNIWEDIGNVFKQKKNSGEISIEEYRLCKEVENAIDENEAIPLETIKRFYNLCVKISYADRLYAELNRRINESFGHIVIRPSMDDYTRYLSKLLGDLEAYINISRNSSALDLISERIGMLKSRIYLEGTCEETAYASALHIIDEIKNTLSVIKEKLSKDNDEENLAIAYRIEKDLKKLLKEIDKRGKGYIVSQIEDINSCIDEIATKLSQLKSEEEIIHYLDSQNKMRQRAISIFNGMSDVPQTIKNTLTTNYLALFRRMIANKESQGAFIEKVSSEMATSLAKEFGIPYKMLYDLFYVHFNGFTKSVDKYTLETRYQKSETWKRETVNSLTSSDRRIRDVLSNLTNMEFQKETSRLVGSIEQYLNKELMSILTEVQENANIQSADISKLLENTLNVLQAPIELPDDLFRFTTPSNTVGRGRVKTGTRTIVNEGLCCDDYDYEDVYEDTYKYSYDNEVGCYNRWISGVDASVGEFWKIINNWLKRQVEIFMIKIKDAVLQVADMIDEMFNNRLRELQDEQNQDMAKLDLVSAKIFEIQVIQNNTIEE